MRPDRGPLGGGLRWRSYAIQTIRVSIASFGWQIGSALMQQDDAAFLYFVCVMHAHECDLNGDFNKFHQPDEVIQFTLGNI